MRSFFVAFTCVILCLSAASLNAAGQKRTEGFNSPSAPDLQSGSDTGFSDADNITRSSTPVFNIFSIETGATVELLREGVTVATSAPATSDTITLTDPSPPADGIVHYKARQTLGAQSTTSPVALTVTFDNTRPASTISQYPGQADPATEQPVVFRIQFSEPTGINAALLDFSGSTAGANGFYSLNPVYEGNGSTRVEVWALAMPGSVIMNFAENATRDEAGNLSLAPVIIDNTVTFAPAPVNINISGRIRQQGLGNHALAHPPLTITLTDGVTNQSYTARVSPTGFYRINNIPFYQNVVRGFTISIKHKEKEILSEIDLIEGSTIFYNWFVP